MLATYHLACCFPGCVHSAIMRETFNWPVVSAPQPEIPDGWSVVLRPVAEDKVNVIAICGKHDFSFDGVRGATMRPVGFELSDKEPDE
jgi:hypothetical protein